MATARVCDGESGTSGRCGTLAAPVVAAADALASAVAAPLLAAAADAPGAVVATPSIATPSLGEQWIGLRAARRSTRRRDDKRTRSSGWCPDCLSRDLSRGSVVGAQGAVGGFRGVKIAHVSVELRAVLISVFPPFSPFLRLRSSFWLEHQGTEEMWDDGNTKPLQGAGFRLFWSKIMGIPED